MMQLIDGLEHLLILAVLIRFVLIVIMHEIPLIIEVESGITIPHGLVVLLNVVTQGVM